MYSMCPINAHRVVLLHSKINFPILDIKIDKRWFLSKNVLKLKLP